MEIIVKASDLYYKYPKDTANRHLPKFCGKPDTSRFNRDDLYEVIPLLSAVMARLGSYDQRVLHQVEEIMIRQLPSCVATREEVFDFLVGSMHDLLEEP